MPEQRDPRDPLLRDDGTPRQITRATFEVISPGRIRWQMWAGGDVLNHSEVIDVEQLPGVLEIAGIMLRDAAGIGVCAR